MAFGYPAVHENLHHIARNIALEAKTAGGSRVGRPQNVSRLLRGQRRGGALRGKETGGGGRGAGRSVSPVRHRGRDRPGMAALVAISWIQHVVCVRCLSLEAFEEANIHCVYMYSRIIIYMYMSGF